MGGRGRGPDEKDVESGSDRVKHGKNEGPNPPVMGQEDHGRAEREDESDDKSSIGELHGTRQPREHHTGKQYRDR